MPSKFIKALGQRLDARPDRIDLRDREFAPPVVSLPARFPDDATVRKLLPAYVRAGLILSQGNEGACTGFGLACVVNYLFWRAEQDKPAKARKKIVTVSTRMLYHLARFYDEWPGEDYDGSSCRGALKAWNKHGVCSDALWPYKTKDDRVRFIKPKPGWDLDALQRQLGVYYRIDRTSIVDMQSAIYGIGAIYVSSDVHDGWDLPAEKDPDQRPRFVRQDPSDHGSGQHRRARLRDRRLQRTRLRRAELVGRRLGFEGLCDTAVFAVVEVRKRCVGLRIGRARRRQRRDDAEGRRAARAARTNGRRRR